VLAGAIIVWLVYWTVEFDYLRSKLSQLSVVNVDAEQSARLFGILGSLLCGIQLLPALRIPLWQSAFAVPYERMLRYHRILGLATFVCITVHAVVWWGKWWQEGNLGNNLFAYDKLYISPYRENQQDFTMPIVTTSWALLGITLVLAVTLRRRVYYLFQYSHKLFGYLFYVVAIYHGWSFW
jgi:predicted ferric reductase